MDTLVDHVDNRGKRPLINGKPLPEGVTMEDWIRLHNSADFYYWLNAIRGCQNTNESSYWRLSRTIGWCGV